MILKMEDRLKLQRLQQRVVLAARDARAEYAIKWEKAHKPVHMPVINGSPPVPHDVLVARALAAIQAKRQKEQAAAELARSNANHHGRQLNIVSKAVELEAKNCAREAAMAVGATCLLLSNVCVIVIVFPVHRCVIVHRPWCITHSFIGLLVGIAD